MCLLIILLLLLAWVIIWLAGTFFSYVGVFIVVTLIFIMLAMK